MESSRPGESSQTIYHSLASEKVSRLIGLLDELYGAPECDALDGPDERKARTTS